MLEMISCGTRKARKDHQCFHCYRPIRRGETYEFSTLKYDYVYTLTMHRDCILAATHFMKSIGAHPNDYDEGHPPLLNQIIDNDGQHDIDALRGYFPHVACRIEFHAQMREKPND